MTTRQGRYFGLVFLKLAFFLFTFLIALQLMILSFKLLNSNILEHIVIATSNPFISLFIGLLATAMLHSSSTTTTTIVAVVASGTVSFENAVFMVMGANIGTTVTSTMVSMGHITKKKEFRKAVTAATVHDFFNILTALILFPLEYYFKILSNLAVYLTSLITWAGTVGIPNPLGNFAQFIEPIPVFILSLIGKSSIIGLFLAVALLFFSIRFIAFVFKEAIFTKFNDQVQFYLFGSPFHSLMSGIILTGIIQSSTVVTSVIVPIVANNKLSMKKAFPFIMGANIGTTFTAFMAALSSSEAALSIALCHVLFNVLGVFIFFPFQSIRHIPVFLARSLAKASVKFRLVGLAYIIFFFFLVPFVLIYFSKNQVKIKTRQHTFINSTQNIMINEASFLNKNHISSKKLIYKQVNMQDDWLITLNQQSSIQVSQKEDTIFINQSWFLLRPKGSCWEGKDMTGNYVMCIEDIKTSFRLNESVFVEECIIYTKKYINHLVSNKFFQRIYFSLDKKMIINNEVINYQGKIIGKEELIGITR